MSSFNTSARIIHRVRQEIGISRQILAEILGVTEQEIIRWETGIYIPDKNTLSAILDIAGLNYIDLISPRYSKKLSVTQEDLIEIHQTLSEMSSEIIELRYKIKLLEIDIDYLKRTQR